MSIQEIILYIVATIITALLSWLLSRVTVWLNKKIKSDKAKSIVNELSGYVSNAVKSTYQTYVASIKGTNSWNQAAQNEALLKAKQIATQELTSDIKSYLSKQNIDIDTYLEELIESTLYDLKYGSKNN